MYWCNIALDSCHQTPNRQLVTIREMWLPFIDSDLLYTDLTVYFFTGRHSYVLPYVRTCYPYFVNVLVLSFVTKAHHLHI